jgi:Domain of unknown function (DUF1929)
MEDARLRGIDRGYHSTAVLMPDATVLSAGSGEFFDDSKKPNNPIDSHRQAQIFHPPYLLRGPRPQIIDSPEEVDYGSEFPVRILGPEVGRVSWIRLSSVTHAFNENQFINFLKFRSGNDGLIVTAPARPELSPPGHYMLFVICCSSSARTGFRPSRASCGLVRLRRGLIWHSPRPLPQPSSTIIAKVRHRSRSRTRRSCANRRARASRSG